MATVVNRSVWDCGSSLYDSFELQAFTKQLDAAIGRRSLSMPRLSVDHSSATAPTGPTAKKSTKLTKSLRRLLRSVFRLKPAEASPTLISKVDYQIGFHISAAWPMGLSTIPEETGFDSPGFDPPVRRAFSERFSVASAAAAAAAVVQFS